jgi:hypothetical protein
MRTRWLLAVVTIIIASFGFVVFFAVQLCQPYTRTDVEQIRPGMTSSDIEAILGKPMPTDVPQPELVALGEVRRGFWQFGEDVWMLVGFDENEKACWIHKYNPEKLPEHPVGRLRRTLGI